MSSDNEIALLNTSSEPDMDGRNEEISADITVNTLFSEPEENAAETTPENISLISPDNQIRNSDTPDVLGIAMRGIDSFLSQHLNSSQVEIIDQNEQVSKLAATLKK